MGSFLNPGTIEFEEALNSEIYIDKSGLIEVTNAVLRTQQKFMCISRPRRFGKSLFLSMLYSYYDCNQKESFEKLFGNLWIGKHPTSLQGIYQVLFLGNLPVHDRFFGIF